MGPRGLNCGPLTHTHQPRAPQRPARLHTRGSHRRRSGAQRPLKGAAGKGGGGRALPDRPTPHCRLRAGRRRGREEEKGGEGRRGAGPAVRAERAAGGCPSNSCGGSGLQTVPRAPAPPPSPGSGGTAGGRPRSPPSLLAPTSGCRPGRRLRRR